MPLRASRYMQNREGGHMIHKLSTHAYSDLVYVKFDVREALWLEPEVVEDVSESVCRI